MLSKRLIKELRQVEADALNLAEDFKASANALAPLRNRADRLRKCHSNSLFGDHALTYYEGFETPPRGFDVEWGLLSGFSGAHNPGWVVYSLEELVEYLYPDQSYEDIASESETLESRSEQVHTKIRDLLSLIRETDDSTLSSVAANAESNIKRLFEGATAQAFAKSAIKSAPNVTRDSRNAYQGMRLPAHISALAQVHFRTETAKALSSAASEIRRILGMAQLKQRAQGNSKSKAAAIFIGHGRSAVWRELQAYLEKELRLTVEEFNRVSVAGVSTQRRLDEMLDASAMAFLVMTGEDQTAEGQTRARENVIHEAGLFQGRLGWTRAIILLEEGCTEFSNIHGVNHIPFRKNNIKDAFVEVQRALAREGLIDR